MAGKIVADTLEHSTAGSIATNYVVEGSAKAWGHMNGSGTPAYGDSFNMASITDNGTGNYAQSFVSSLDNASYSASGTNGDGSAQTGGVICNRSAVYATGSYGFTTTYTTGSTPAAYDPSDVSTAIHGELA